VDISSGVCIRKSVHSDNNNNEVIKRNQYSEIEDYTEEKYRKTVIEKTEK
jgi:hypothetical protein